MTAKRGSPWSALGRKLTDEEWTALKEWRKIYPDLKYKMGDAREGGMFFIHYNPTCKNGERWASFAVLNRDRLSALHRTRASLANDETRKKILGRLKVRRFLNREKFIKEDKRRANEMRERLGTDEVKKRHKEAVYKYRESPQGRQTARKALSKWRSKVRGTESYRATYTKNTAKRRAAKKNPFHIFDTTGVSKIYDSVPVLEKKLGAKCVVDHVIPLSGGGLHQKENLQVIPEHVNLKKSAKLFWISDLYLDFRDVPEALWPENLKPHYHLMLRIFGHPLKKLAEAI